MESNIEERELSDGSTVYDVVISETNHRPRSPGTKDVIRFFCADEHAANALLEALQDDGVVGFRVET